ncbi:MAG: hypothetical protein H0U13_09035, partial [Gemmatimonadaceae bacterium]|nr:hypothetical protein [Gemmatimonadaceae bacterium]
GWNWAKFAVQDTWLGAQAGRGMVTPAPAAPSRRMPVIVRDAPPGEDDEDEVEIDEDEEDEEVTP